MQKNATRDKILETVELLVNKKPIEKVTVSEITTACSLTRQTFYIHFIDKYDAINAVYLKDIEEGIAYFSYGKLGYGATILFVLNLIRQKSVFYRNAFKSHGQNSLTSFMFHFNFCFHYILQCHLHGTEHLDDSVTSIIRFWSYGATAFIINWVLGGMKTPDIELAEFLENRAPENLRNNLSILKPEEWDKILEELRSIKS